MKLYRAKYKSRNKFRHPTKNIIINFVHSQSVFLKLCYLDWPNGKTLKVGKPLKNIGQSFRNTKHNQFQMDEPERETALVMNLRNITVTITITKTTPPLGDDGKSVIV